MLTRLKSYQGQFSHLGHVFNVQGMFSREVRDGTSRVGFEVVDAATAQAGELAHMYQRDGPRVGKYQVNLDDL